MKIFASFAALAVLLLLPARASAQVSLQIQDGLVTLDAQNVSIRQILAEWGRIGGARIVNGEKVTGGLVTLQLKDMPERKALDTILRGVSGYMLASRQAGTTGVSGFDRILILPTSAAPRTATAPNNPAFAPRPMPVQSVEAEPEVVDDDEDVADPDASDEDSEEVVQPPPGVNPRFQRRPTLPSPMGTQGQPFMPGNFPGAPPPVNDDEDEDGEPPQPASTSPFNVPPGASATPGVIAPVPQQDPRQPRATRPPRPPL